MIFCNCLFAHSTSKSPIHKQCGLLNSLSTLILTRALSKDKMETFCGFQTIQYILPTYVSFSKLLNVLFFVISHFHQRHFQTKKIPPFQPEK